MVEHTGKDQYMLMNTAVSYSAFLFTLLHILNSGMLSYLYNIFACRYTHVFLT